MPPLHLRQEFPTLRHFKEALHAWAIEAHFEPRILKSDTGRVRVGCKRDPNCPFVIRCNWERKNGREPLARVTVLRERHTCINGVLNSVNGTIGGNAGAGGGDWGNGLGNNGMGAGLGVNGDMGVVQEIPQLEIRTDPNTGSVIGGARVLGPISRPNPNNANVVQVPVPAAPLPKVQRNSASRLPFLMEILPRLMRITKETTPGEIRDCLMREYGAEVHLQQCRRAKTEILKRREQELDQQQQGQQVQGQNGEGSGSGGDADALGSSDAGDNNTNNNGNSNTNGTGNAPMFGNPGGGMEGTPGLQTPSTMHATPSLPSANDVNVGISSDYPLPLHTASGVVIPQVTPRREAALNAVGEQPVRCPYCVNHRWMRTVRDAVEHMSMHVVV